MRALAVLAFFIMQITMFSYACVGLDVINNNENYAKMVQPNDRYKQNTDTIKALFVMTILL